jgi:hypothetical protein
LRELDTDPICVLSGAGADEQLRRCRSIAEVELVYDTNGPEVSLLTNIKAGLAAAEGEACFVLPVEIPCPSQADYWRVLKEGWRQGGLHSQIALVQLLTAQGAPWHYGFPLLVTRFGNEEIRRLEGVKSLLDTRLKYLHLRPLAAATLAPAAKAL